MNGSGSLRALALLLALASAPAALAAQESRATLMGDFERQRANVLAYLDAMPASGLRTAPTEGVRDFAEQIEHIAMGAVSIVGSGFERPVDLGLDRNVYLDDKAALAGAVNAAYDRVGEILRGMSDADLMATGDLFGQVPNVPRWRIARTAYEHGVWTLGATVPYLRLQGATPPEYDLIPTTGG